MPDPDPQAPLPAEALESIRARTARINAYSQFHAPYDRRRLLAEVDRLRGERDWLGAAWRSALQRAEQARAERDDYQVRLRATDRSWSRVAAERDRLRTAWTSARRGRDEAMTAVDRLVEESDRHARQRDEARAERDRYRDSWTSARRELATRVERLELAQSDHDHLADRVAALEQGGGHDAEEDR